MWFIDSFWIICGNWHGHVQNSMYLCDILMESIFAIIKNHKNGNRILTVSSMAKHELFTIISLDVPVFPCQQNWKIALKSL